MLKPPHEATHRIFHSDRMLVVRAFRTLLDIEFPEPTSVAIVDSDVTDATVLEGQVDSVFIVETAAGKHVVALEAQTADPSDKRRAWPFYIASLHKKHEAQVSLLVVCPNRATAQRARRPIEIGLPGHPSQVTYPLVLGPDNVPQLLTTEQAASDVILAVLSAITHRFSPEVEQILSALSDALDLIDQRTGDDLAELTAVGLTGSAGQQIWRELMGTKFKTRTFFDDWRDEIRAEVRAEGLAEGIAEGRTKGIAEGQAKGEARALLAVLSARGIDVPEAAREQITNCSDAGTLSTWIERAANASSIDDVLG